MKSSRAQRSTLGGYASTNLEAVEMDTLKRPAPRPRNSRLKCLLSERIGLAALAVLERLLKGICGLDGHSRGGRERAR